MMRKRGGWKYFQLSRFCQTCVFPTNAIDDGLFVVVWDEYSNHLSRARMRLRFATTRFKVPCQCPLSFFILHWNLWYAAVTCMTHLLDRNRTTFWRVRTQEDNGLVTPQRPRGIGGNNWPIRQQEDLWKATPLQWNSQFSTRSRTKRVTTASN